MEILVGRTRSFDLTVLTASGGAYNLTGATLYFTVKSRLSDADAVALISKSSPSTGITIVDAVAGTAQITFAATDTTVSMIGDYLAELTLKTSTGEIYTVLRQSFQIQQVVRRAAP